jgi:hypothetical protein
MYIVDVRSLHGTNVESLCMYLMVYSFLFIYWLACEHELFVAMQPIFHGESAVFITLILKIV